MQLITADRRAQGCAHEASSLIRASLKQSFPERKALHEEIEGAPRNKSSPSLRQVEMGAKVLDVCRKHGISDATFYNRKARYGGMDVSQLRRLKELEGENAS